jgi:hypothetical protein
MSKPLIQTVLPKNHAKKSRPIAANQTLIDHITPCRQHRPFFIFNPDHLSWRHRM